MCINKHVHHCRVIENFLILLIAVESRKVLAGFNESLGTEQIIR